MQIQENKSEKKQQVITRTKRFAITYEQTNTTTRNRTGDRGGGGRKRLEVWPVVVRIAMVEGK